MKILIISFCLWGFGLTAQICDVQVLILSNQNQVDSFATQYPLCTHFKGFIKISGDDINNLDSFQNMTYLSGNFTIENAPNLDNLNGLRNIDTITNSFTVSSCNNLENLYEMTSLNMVGDVSLKNNSNLEYGLPAIQKCFNIFISGNPRLKNIDGFVNVTKIGRITIQDNYDLQNIDGIRNINEIDFDFKLINCPVVKSCDILNNLVKVSGIINIEKCHSLKSIDCPVLKTLGSLKIEDNESMAYASGFDSIISIYDVEFRSNAKLKKIACFQNLKKVRHNLAITENLLLDNLKGFEVTDTILGYLNIRLQYSLEICPKFNSLLYVEALYLGDNGFTTIDGFSNLIIVDKVLSFHSIKLSTIRGFEKVKRIGTKNFLGQILIQGSPGFSNWVEFDAFNAVDSIFTNLTIANYSGKNMNAFKSLKYIELDLSINSAPKIKNLDNFSNLRTVNSFIDIYHCDSLVNIYGIRNVDLTTIHPCNNCPYLTILDCPMLCHCEVESICSFLENHENPIDYIFVNNNTGCNSKAEILELCNQKRSTTLLQENEWIETSENFPLPISNQSATYHLRLKYNECEKKSLMHKPFDSNDWNDTGYKLTEDEGKIYLDKESSALLYDFKAQINLIIESPLYNQALIVTNIDSFQLENGEWRQRQYLICEGDVDGKRYGVREWIEDIGDRRGFLSPMTSCTQGDSSNLNCFFTNGTRLYHSEKSDENCLLTSTINNTVNDKVRITPNPVTDILRIEYDGVIQKCVIYSTSGYKIMTDTAATINVSSLPAGMYFVRVYSNRGDVVGRFMKQ